MARGQIQCMKFSSVVLLKLHTEHIRATPTLWAKAPLLWLSRNPASVFSETDSRKSTLVSDLRRGEYRATLTAREIRGVKELGSRVSCPIHLLAAIMRAIQFLTIYFFKLLPHFRIMQFQIASGWRATMARRSSPDNFLSVNYSPEAVDI